MEKDLHLQQWQKWHMSMSKVTYFNVKNDLWPRKKWPTHNALREGDAAQCFAVCCCMLQCALQRFHWIHRHQPKGRYRNTSISDVLQCGLQCVFLRMLQCVLRCDLSVRHRGSIHIKGRYRNTSVSGFLCWVAIEWPEKRVEVCCGVCCSVWYSVWCSVWYSVTLGGRNPYVTHKGDTVCDAVNIYTYIYTHIYVIQLVMQWIHMYIFIDIYMWYSLWCSVT